MTATKNCWTDYGSFTKITFKQLHRKKDKILALLQMLLWPANAIVLFLFWVMKDVILIYLMTTLPQFM